MIKEILKGLFIESLAPGELALKLGISPDNLKDMLHNMEHMGYIREVCDEGAPGTCTGTCACTAATSCHQGSNYPPGKKYVLTEKGKKVCCRE
ncbi:MAG: hypothetical protein PWR29_1745 [Methanolobus sp.]|jgi:Mn-dependent DtxR family transcriptional regulator|nr:hypothetical protein [Methanolobus sp.]MDK2834285.1 hypothetical protein [Methanolobus sp.]MDK2912788.1 hypothetical protein [Methanolobus sp.]MDN5309538.1 hypothetical protein [Methanolobus sp.]